MKSFANKVAAITGAGSGIGRALAISLANQGCHVAISDVDEKGLQETVSLLGNVSVKVTHQLVDVADKDAVYAWAEQVVADHGYVNIIMNNAGVALGDTVENMKYDDFEWLMNINFWGVVYGTKAFLPYLKQVDEGHIVNISSVFGLIGVPTQSAYNAAKFAVRGFTESLREELEIEGSSVSATSVHPGGIKTNIARNSRMGDVGSITKQNNTVEEAAKQFDKLARTTPDGAAQIILDGVKKNKARVLVGFDAHVIDSMQRLLPTTYQKLLVFGAKRVS
ncbi:MAG: SDR family NAD(P)-dependent oxidoreductase [Pseudomonadales bacterium]|nr:SDR family NAD(P)-dependent oxidoreductase [Pseudomonadales bacterium]